MTSHESEIIDMIIAIKQRQRPNNTWEIVRNELNIQFGLTLSIGGYKNRLLAHMKKMSHGPAITQVLVQAPAPAPVPAPAPAIMLTETQDTIPARAPSPTTPTVPAAELALEPVQAATPATTPEDITVLTTRICTLLATNNQLETENKRLEALLELAQQTLTAQVTTNSNWMRRVDTETRRASRFEEALHALQSMNEAERSTQLAIQQCLGNDRRVIYPKSQTYTNHNNDSSIQPSLYPPPHTHNTQLLRTRARSATVTKQIDGINISSNDDESTKRDGYNRTEKEKERGDGGNGQRR
jgi:hypothetical protein